MSPDEELLDLLCAAGIHTDPPEPTASVFDRMTPADRARAEALVLSMPNAFAVIAEAILCGPRPRLRLAEDPSANDRRPPT